MPVTRFVTRSPRQIGGLSVRLVPDDPQSVVVRFLDNEGSDITEDFQRKIERLFQREDYRRVFAAEIGDIGFLPRAVEDYAIALESTVEIETIAASRFKVVLDHAYGSTSLVMPNVLAKLGADVLAVICHLDDGGDLVRPPGPRRQRRQPGAGLRRPPRRGHRAGWGTNHSHRRRRPCAHRQRVLAGNGHPRNRPLCSVTASPSPSTSRRERRRSRKRRASGCSAHKLSAPALMDVANEPGVGFAASGDGGLHPARVPAGLRCCRDVREGARPPRLAAQFGSRRSSPNCRAPNRPMRRR